MSKWCVVGVLWLSAGSAFAQSLEEKQWRKEEEKSFADRLKDTNKRCTASIVPSIDWSTWKSARDESNHRAAASCATVYPALNKVCSTDDGKASVSKTIKKVVCMGDGSEAKVELDGDTLKVHVPFSAKTSAEKLAHEYLLKNLK